MIIDVISEVNIGNCNSKGGFNLSTLTAAMQRFISENSCLVATANKECNPNVAPKGTFRALNEETLVYAEIDGHLTYKNLLENPYVCVIAFKGSERAMVRCNGKAELIAEGQLYAEMAAHVAKRGLPPPKAVVKITVTDICSSNV